MAMDISTGIELMNMILSGGTHAIIVILCIVIFALLMDRRRMLKDAAKAELRIDKILEDYRDGNATLADALKSLAMLMAEIRGGIFKANSLRD